MKCGQLDSKKCEQVLNFGRELRVEGTKFFVKSTAVYSGYKLSELLLLVTLLN